MYIISLFKSEDAVIRLNALQVWGTFKLNSTSTSLVSPSLHVSRILPLLNDNDNRIRLMAINLLDTKDLGSFDVVDLLYKALQSNDTAIRVAAMGALRKGDVSSTNIVDKLLDILRSDDLEEAEKAALTLSKIKDTMLRQRVVIEAQQLISDSLKGKYAYNILWNLLVTTVKNSKSASLAL